MKDIFAAQGTSVTPEMSPKGPMRPVFAAQGITLPPKMSPMKLLWLKTFVDWGQVVNVILVTTLGYLSSVW